jgi:hypothetical protein
MMLVCRASDVELCKRLPDDGFMLQADGGCGIETGYEELERDIVGYALYVAGLRRVLPLD